MPFIKVRGSDLLFGGNASSSDGVKRSVAILVVFCIIRAVFTAAHVVKPSLVLLVPVDGLSKSRFQTYLRLPPKFVLNFIAIQCIPPIVSRAILDVGKQGFGFVDKSQQLADNHQIFCHFRTADIIGLADSTLEQHRQNAAAIIFNVQPVALLFAIAINGQSHIERCIEMCIRDSFCTAPAIRSLIPNLISEIVGTFVLVFVVGAIFSRNVAATGPGSLGPYLVGSLVWGIGLSLGGTTGYAINPARDLGPRVAHTLLPIAAKGGSDWSYAPVPVIGPLLGGALAGWILRILAVS